MVSLSDDRNRSGAYFFEEPTPSVQSRDPEETMTDSMSLNLVANKEKQDHRINTSYVIVIHIIVVVAIWVLSFVLPNVCTKTATCGIGSYELILYIIGGTWFLVLGFDRYYRWQHYYNRIHGYLNFYRRTRNIRRLPLLIFSAGNTVLLIVSQILTQECTGTSCGSMTTANYIQIVISLSSAVQIILLVIYLLRTVQFNRSGASPDVNQEEMVTSFLNSNSGSMEVGFRDENFLDQVMERQADMIRYLKQHNAQLGKRILNLTEENKKLKSKSSS